MKGDDFERTIERLRETVLATPGASASGLAPFAEKVAREAFRITDEDVASLKAKGHSEDAIFEATLTAALNAGLVRLERGLAALRGGA